MRRRALGFTTEIMLLILGIELIVVAPDFAFSILVPLILVLLLGAALSIIYLARIYYRQSVPRSRFFGMLLGVTGRVQIAMLWIGYLVLGRIGDRTGWYDLPTPPPNISSPISGLVLCLAITPPILYAVTVWRVRHAASAMVTGGEELIDLEHE